MNNFTKNIGKLFLLCFAILLTQTNTFAQGTCATAVALTVGTQQCGDTADGGDTFDDNACLGSYDGGDDYLFTYTASAGDAGSSLQLDLTSSGSWTGIAISEGCPEGGGGVCAGAATSSAGDESVTSDPLVAGSTYYIHISTWPSPQNVPFCLDAAIVAAPTPPTNDDCGGAIALTVNGDLACGTVTSGTIALATASPEDPTACSGTEDDDVWFTFVATATSHEIDLLNVTGSTTDLYHSLWEGACGSLTHQGLCSDPNSSTATGLTIGATYHLRVYSWTSTAGQTSAFDVCIGTLPPPPANDACTGAISVGEGAMVGMMDISGATDVEGLAPCSGGGGSLTTPGCDGGTGLIDWSPGVWYSYESTGPGIITVDTDGSDFDTEIQIFEGTCGALTCVGGDDDAGASSQSSICWESTATARGAAPVTYYIYVDGHNGATGNLVLNIVLAPLPVELLSFEGKVEETSNMLMWETATEENTEKHVIERSLDGRSDWEFVGEKAAAGFATETQSYMLEDTKPLAKAYYRLRSVDFDGYQDISDIVYLERKTDRFDIIGVAPVPTKGTLAIDFETVSDVEVALNLTDMLGNTIIQKNIGTAAGINREVLDLSNLASGVYFVTIHNGLEKVTKRVVKH